MLPLSFLVLAVIQLCLYLSPRPDGRWPASGRGALVTLPDVTAQAGIPLNGRDPLVDLLRELRIATVAVGLSSALGHQGWDSTATAETAPGPPRLWARPMSAPATCIFPARPSNWSWMWLIIRIPDEPIG